jgi:hypothetical protein
VLWIRIPIRIRIIFLTWIRIRIKKNQDPHLDPHQSDKLDPETDPDLHQFGDDNPNQGEKSDPHPHRIKVCIRIRMRVISQMRIHNTDRY